VACENEQTRLDSALARLQELERELHRAAPSDKPAIVEEIEAQNDIVDAARADYDDCVQRNNVPPETIAFGATFIVAYSGPFVGDKEEREAIQSAFEFLGPRDVRSVRLTGFEIRRDAVTQVTPGVGTYVNSTGAFSIPADLDITYGDNHGSGQLLLATWSASSPSGKYAGVGSALDRGTLELVLVGQLHLLRAGGVKQPGEVHLRRGRQDHHDHLAVDLHHHRLRHLLVGDICRGGDVLRGERRGMNDADVLDLVPVQEVLQLLQRHREAPREGVASKLHRLA